MSAHTGDNPPSAAAGALIAIDAGQPLRITWPLDIGPENGGAQPDGTRVCLRARQGVNELQNPEQGTALYAFQTPSDGQYNSWFRVRWLDDGVGHIMCNNSWFAAFDDQPPAVIGNETNQLDWFWQQGPTLTLNAGLHWLRVELREDGTFMDKVVIVPAEEKADSARLDEAPVMVPRGLAGSRPAATPDAPVNDVEIYALPAAALHIGAGHVNQITVCATYQAPTGPGFEGGIEILCATAPGLTVSATDDRLACSLEVPFARRVITLNFPDDTPRRDHYATVLIRAADGNVVFRHRIRFIKGYAWAFLGPFPDQTEGSKKIYRYTGAIGGLERPCDADPARIAARAEPEALGLPSLQPATPGKPGAWRIVSDGSCYDWTGAVDLSRVYGKSGPGFAYAVTWLNAETVLNHRSFTVQLDDSGWVWVNGHRVITLPVDLPREAQRLWTSAPLKKGANAVVVKITQNQRYWGFRFDVVDWHWQGRRGDVVTGLGTDAWPK